MTTLCRDCGELGTSALPGERCRACGSPRLVSYPELESLVDRPCRLRCVLCGSREAYRPELADRPVIIGGGVRGVVLACCYAARLYGVHSAMPMFKALAACPDAVVIDRAERQQISCKDRLRNRQAAGFAVLSEAPAFLADKPVSLLWGVGAAMQRRLAGDGVTLVGQLGDLGERELTARHGRIGTRLVRLARGEHYRAVLAHPPTHSISAETTLARDEADAEVLSRVLWPLCERVSTRLKQASLAAGTVTLKLKTADFRLRTRSRRIADPTQLPDTLFHIASGLLAAEADGVTLFRLIGVAAEQLFDSRLADPPTLFDSDFAASRRNRTGDRRDPAQARREIGAVRPRPTSSPTLTLARLRGREGRGG